MDVEVPVSPDPEGKLVQYVFPEDSAPQPEEIVDQRPESEGTGDGDQGSGSAEGKEFQPEENEGQRTGSGSLEADQDGSDLSGGSEEGEHGGYRCGLAEETLQIAREELGERPEVRDRDVQAFRERVLENKALNCPTDDYYLLMFLRTSKFDYDRAYQRLINYHTTRCRNWDVYMRMLPSQIRDTSLADGVATVLPSRDKQGRRIILLRPARWRHTDYPMLEIHKTNLINAEMILEDEETTVNGFVVLADFSGTGMSVMSQMDRRETKISGETLQEAYPIRFKACYIINTSTMFGFMFGMFKTFMKQKIKDRIYFVKNNKGLLKYFDKSALPQEYGGTLPKADQLAEQWREAVLSREDKFLELKTHRIVLERKIGEADTDTNQIVTSVMGTFKKLDV